MIMKREWLLAKNSLITKVKKRERKKISRIGRRWMGEFDFSIIQSDGIIIEFVMMKLRKLYKRGLNGKYEG